jgi:alpha-D-xyloside xylohydrolase
MQLHGRGKIAPWTLPDHADETVALYRYWATLHHALVPFFYSLAEEAYAASPADARAILRPVGEPASWPGDYRYMLGDALLVAPLLDATGKRAVPLPAGARWYDWWTTATSDGGATVSADFSADRAKLPLWVREGAIVPVDIESDLLGLGTTESRGARTLLVWPSVTPSAFAVHEADGAVMKVSQQATATGWSVKLSAVPTTALVRVRADVAPASVDGAGTSATYDAATRTSIVKVAAQAGPLTITARNP